MWWKLLFKGSHRFLAPSQGGKFEYVVSMHAPALRMILLSMVESADKNANGVMEWDEFRGFGDFDLVADKWPKMWETLQTEMLAGLWTGGSGSDKTCCAPSSSDLLRCRVRSLIFRMRVLSIQVLQIASGDCSSLPQLVSPPRLLVPIMGRWGY